MSPTQAAAFRAYVRHAERSPRARRHADVTPLLQSTHRLHETVKNRLLHLVLYDHKEAYTAILYDTLYKQQRRSTCKAKL